MFDEWSGLWIPKHKREVAQWRREVIVACDNDNEVRGEFAKRLRASPVLFCNLFCWTFRPWFYDETGAQRKLPDDQRRQMFVTWPCQDREIIAMHRAVEDGRHLWAVKSREMGWTWTVLTYMVWRFLFFRGFNSLVTSRKEDEVYKSGDPDTLYEKLLYNLQPDVMPKWIIPGYGIKELHLTNPVTKSTISGESTNQHIGRGGRRDIVLVDEAAAVTDLEAIDAALFNAAGTKIYLSTPDPGSYFDTLATHPGFEHRTMPWWEHPEFGHARRIERVERGVVKYTSPWHEKNRPPFVSERSYNKNIAMSVGGAGDMLFPLQLLQTHAELFAREPAHVGDILFANVRRMGDDGRERSEATMLPDELAEADPYLRARDARPIRWADRSAGPWKLWCKLERDVGGVMRPRQDTVYGIGCDPGDGRQSANSTIFIGDMETGEQVAEFASADYSARDLARILVAAALWFGGARLPLINWETNGIGGNLTEMLNVKIRYPNLWVRRKSEKRRPEDVDDIGWHSSPPTKRVAIDNFADAIASATVKVRSRALLDEARTFIVYDQGGVGQAKLRDLTTGARDSHGDRVIGGALFAMTTQSSQKLTPGEALLRKAADDPRTMHGRTTLRRRENERARAKVHPWNR